ncbi:eukaryotic translation initiation factor 4 gamma 3-like [Platichthys flesus]|uniref:eukaryotic translation initiation factor 4 gamma 3-like n=1 Tax=Platichthys flesus TaxID=8260 RepID=UPI002DBDC13F|nr:eukaryotic translation initiation factor 4 gamma 3-like [Platichthys flesus]
MHDCVVNLLNNNDEECLACLCSLLTSIGKVLDLEEAKPQMDQYITQLEKILTEGKISSRIRLMLQDVIDLRLAGQHCAHGKEQQDHRPKEGSKGPQALQSSPSPQPSTAPPQKTDSDARTTLGSRSTGRKGRKSGKRSDKPLSAAPPLPQPEPFTSSKEQLENPAPEYPGKELDKEEVVPRIPSDSEEESEQERRVPEPEKPALSQEKIVLEDIANEEQTFECVKENLDESRLSLSPFMRELMSAVCEAAAKDNTKCRVDMALLQKSLPVFNYSNSDTEQQLHALHSLQALIVTLDQPPNLLRIFFDCMYDGDVISEDPFYYWGTSSRPEQLGKGVALESLTAFFTWLREAEQESQEN